MDSEKRWIYFSQEEWATFWKREYTILLTVAVKILGDRGEAEEALQEAIESLLRSGRKELEERNRSSEATVRAFLVKVVRFKAIDILRRRAREKDMLEKLTSQAQSDTETQLLRKDVCEELLQDFDIQEIADKLTPKLKELFLFRIAHFDRDPEDLWHLWVQKNGTGLEDKKKNRNRFDTQSSRLRKILLSMGVFEVLKKGGAHYVS